MNTKLKLGVVGTADIAYRRFLPSLIKSEHFEYVGVASRSIDKTNQFIGEYGGKGYEGYDEILEDKQIDVVYIPLPPSLHYQWAKKALLNGKHVLLEKPFTINDKQTNELIDIAKDKNLAIFENYMFMYHSQLNTIKDIIQEKEIGEVRHYRIAFGFPMRGKDDFRYNKDLGGGALLDCGGYTIKLATELLGDTTQLICSSLNYEDEYPVDLYGSATLKNKRGIVAQVTFGMDNAYKCELEVWGSKASILASRIFTAGDGFNPKITITTSSDSKEIVLESDDQFLNAINDFYKCISDLEYRNEMFTKIQRQSHIMENIMLSK